MHRFRSRKVIVALALAVIVTQVFGIFVYAAPTQDDLETAIRTVRQRIAIPEQCSEFSSEFSDSEYSGSFWNLTWRASATDYNSRSITVSIDTDFNITYYYDNGSDYYSSYNKVARFPKISTEQAQDIAVTFIKKALPELVDQLDFENVTVSNSGLIYSNFSLNVSRHVNGVPVESGTVYVTVNTDTGNVLSLSTNWDYDAKLDSMEGIIDAQAGLDAYKREYPLRLMYSTEGKTISLAYFVNSDSNQYIDAKTGEKATVENYYSPYYGAGNVRTAEAAVADSTAGNLTQQEITNIQEVEKLMTIEEGTAILQGMSLAGIDSSYDKSSYSSYSKTLEGYQLYISMYKLDESGNVLGNASATFDATTKKLISLWVYDYNSNARYGGEAAATTTRTADTDKTANEFIAKYASDVADKLDQPIVSEFSNVEYAFAQVENGIPFRYHGVTVSIDAQGNVVNYSRSIFKDEIPAATGIISADKANEIFANEIGVELAYIMNNPRVEGQTPNSSKNGNVWSLFYRAKPVASSIDAVTGDVNYDLYSRFQTLNIQFNDIEDSIYKEEIETLANYNIFLPENNFRPKDIITQAELFGMLANINDDNKYYLLEYAMKNVEINDYYDSIYNNMLYRGIIRQQDMEPDKEITREQAVVYLFDVTFAAGISTDYPSAFNMTYADAAEIQPDNVGYMALCEALDLLSTSDGNVNPAGKMTREQAAHMIYNFLDRK